VAAYFTMQSVTSDHTALIGEMNDELDRMTDELDRMNHEMDKKNDKMGRILKKDVIA
jgi:TolA-binding protein